MDEETVKLLIDLNSTSNEVIRHIWRMISSSDRYKEDHMGFMMHLKRSFDKLGIRQIEGIQGLPYLLNLIMYESRMGSRQKYDSEIILAAETGDIRQLIKLEVDPLTVTMLYDEEYDSILRAAVRGKQYALIGMLLSNPNVIERFIDQPELLISLLQSQD